MHFESNKTLNIQWTRETSTLMHLFMYPHQHKSWFVSVPRIRTMCLGCTQTALLSYFKTQIPSNVFFNLLYLILTFLELWFGLWEALF